MCPRVYAERNAMRDWHFRNFILAAPHERLKEEPSRDNALHALVTMQRTVDAVAAWAPHCN